MLESRADGAAVLRRRECLKCKGRVWTVEAARGEWDKAAPMARVKRGRKVTKDDVPGFRVRAAARRVLEEKRDMLVEDEPVAFTVDDLKRELGW